MSYLVGQPARMESDMKILLYQGFKKRYNSTKVPTDITPVEKNVSIKANFGFENQNQSTKCSIEHPSFFLADAQLYSYLKAWGMYYFIDSIEYDINGAQYITCSLDVLATWKDRILEHTAFVVYSSTDYSTRLVDPRVPKLDNVTEYVSSPYNTVFSDDPAHNYDLLWIAGERGVRCYSCNVDTIISALYNKASTSLVSNLCASWSDAQSCILYCRTYCLDYEPGTHTESVIIGKVDTEEDAVRVDNEDLCFVSPDITIPIGGSYTDFRRFEFTSMSIYLPYVGTVNLNISDFIDNPSDTANVNIKYTVNFGSGTIVYMISTDDGKIIGTYNGVAGRAKPVSIVSPFNGLGVLTSSGAALGSATVGLLSATPAGAAIGIGGAIAGVAGAFSATYEQDVNSVGSCDGSASELLSPSIILTVKEYSSRIEPSNLTDLAGRPCNKVISLANLTGYVQTAGFSADIEALSSVRESINSLMDSGVYIE